MLTWSKVVHGPLSPAIDGTERELLEQASQSLPPEPWAADTWSAWTRQLTAISGRKGRALFQPLRRALTARDHGPELARLLPLMGRDRVLAQLQGQAA